MAGIKRIYNILRYGIGADARRRKRAVKATARKSRFIPRYWQRKDDIVTRNYSTYEEYLLHQASKLEKISHRLHEKEQEDLAQFKQRFSTCEALTKSCTVLCLGARLGTEVKALHELGHFALGIDLNPGADNPYVLPGDFHNTVFPDECIDVVYSNALDHVFNLEKVIKEVGRILRPNGLFIADIIAGFSEGFTPGAYEALHWKDTATLCQQITSVGCLNIESSRDLDFTRRDQWFQVVFRKPITAPSASTRHSLRALPN